MSHQSTLRSAICATACLSLAAVAACGGGSDNHPNGNTFDTSGGQILFVSDLDGNEEIYRVNVDGSNLINLTNNPADDGQSGFNEETNFDWASDGKRIAFGSSRGQSAEIFVMNADGSDQTQVSTAGNTGEPRWSPDGARIAFVSSDEEQEGKEYIYVVNSDGSGQTRLHAGAHPDWSPDGERIAFKDGGIWTMNADGSASERLTDTEDQYFAPFWSPDGTQILFSSYRDGENGSLYSKIFAMNADGTELVGLPPGADDEDHYGAPAWSPDGEWVAYYTDHLSGVAIHTMSIDGSNVARLDTALLAIAPRWSPEGSRFAFSGTNASGETGVYVMNVDGTELTSIASNASELFVEWSPVGPPQEGVRAEPLRPGTPTPSPTPSPAAKVLVSGTLAFASHRDGNYDIYVVNADGSGLRDATTETDHDFSPAWSPDGSMIAFSSSRGGDKREIYVMNADGSNQRRVSSNIAEAIDEYPTWSPDGRRIAFFRSDRFDNNAIHVVNSDGSGQAVVTEEAASRDFTVNTFGWRSDGRQIVFVSERDGNAEIYAIEIDGTGLTNLTNNPADDVYPSWSPDGPRIAFVREIAGGLGRGADIYAMNTDGSDQINMTSSAEDEYAPAWSPDGMRLAFLIGSNDAYTINADGSGIRLVSNFADARISDLAWSPDGNHVALVAENAGTDVSEIYIVGADGSGSKRLVEGLGNIGDIAWAPPR